MSEQIDPRHEFKVPRPAQFHCAHVIGRNGRGEVVYCGVPRQMHGFVVEEKKKRPVTRVEPMDGP